MSPTERDRRILLVHAHPDDESISTGATMAKYAAAGAHVCLVTCTLGEEGEVIPDELRYLASDKEDRLGEYRIGELDAACAALGVTDHRFLGGAGRWRDSGMMGAPTNDDPRCFWRADLDEAAAPLLEIIAEVRPQVMITYDANGYYGHPDHIQAHRVAWHAFTRSEWPVAKFYATATPWSVAQRMAAARPEPFEQVASAEEYGFGVPDDQVTTVIDAREQLAAKLAALAAHRTQVTVEPPFFALSNNIGQVAEATEYYTLLAGERGSSPAGGRETDLFAGLDLPEGDPAR